MQHDLNGLVELLLHVCIMDGKLSVKNLFIDGVSHKRKWVGSYSERCSQTGFFVDSAEKQCTDIKFILNTFPSRCDGCSVFASNEKRLLCL